MGKVVSVTSDPRSGRPAQEPYENLANSIIVQAVHDYCEAREKLKKDSHDIFAQSTIIECEQFFRGRWFKSLANINGRGLIYLCKRHSAEILKTAHVHPRGVIDNNEL